MVRRWWSLLLAVGLALAVLGPASPVAAWTGVTSEALNVRAAPTTRAAVLTVLPPGTSVEVVAETSGQAVAGNATWYRLVDGGYVHSAFVTAASRSGQARPAETARAGRWIEVRLGAQQATAYEDGRPVYTAAVTTGRPGWETPVGTFRILRRVANETMDSATVGIPRESPEGYYLTNVLYTQYFTPYGHALHYNWWSSREVFGRRPTSRGCVGMDLAAAQFFWRFATVGTPVIIRP
jgi:lipoprotein-anchoring transpeptidase ErfK/SrfK